MGRKSVFELILLFEKSTSKFLLPDMISSNSMEQLCERIKQRKIFFLVGSGISSCYPACLPSAYEILKLTASFALPTTEDREVERVINIIQPEIFYERLMILIGDLAIEPWRILKRYNHHRTSSGYTLGPTLAHFLITQYSALASVPIITTNFDTLFEEATKALGYKPVQSIPFGFRTTSNQEVAILKVHGSIDQEDHQAKLKIMTTMAMITQPNVGFIKELHSLMKTHHLCLIAYSGRDIDIFPYLKGMSNVKTPFWIDISFKQPPKNEAERLLFERAENISAITIGQRLDEIVQSTLPNLLDEIRNKGISVDDLEILKTRELESQYIRSKLISEEDARLRNLLIVDENLKIMFLGLCLNVIGLPKESLDYLSDKYKKLISNLQDEHAILLAVMVARILDCVSDYDGSLREALFATRKARRLLLTKRISYERINLLIQSLHQVAMARKMQYGPVIQYGFEEIDFVPTKRLIFWSMFIHFWHLVQMRFVLSVSAFLRPRNLMLLFEVPSSKSNVYLINAWYWYLDHKIVFYAFFDSLGKSTKLGRLNSFQWFLSLFLKRLRRQALTVGDSFALGNIDKYIFNLTGEKSAEENAIITYRLITNPLNLALLHRNSGERLFRDGLKNEAEKEFRKCYNLAKECRSYATMLKAVLGLYACGIPLNRNDIQIFKDHITGWGYLKYLTKLERQARFK